MDLSDLTYDPDLGSTLITIIRDPGSATIGGGYFGPGGFVTETPQEAQSATTQIQAIVYPSTPQEAQLLAEGDRVSAAITILSATPLYIERKGPPSQAGDIVLFGGLQYRVARVLPWNNYGFSEAIAVQIERA